MSVPLLVTGAGGVGKTTISAALAIRAAEAGLDTLVLTVDPAKRLASALGVEDIGGEPTTNPELPTLAAAMLDSASSWAEIARRHAQPAVADRLVNNEFFTTITRHFPASQSYAAAEKMADYLDTNRWDVVVVDTPPSAGGIEFFTAPGDMRDLIGGRLLRWLTGASLPGRRALFRVAGRPALRLADTVLGSDLLERVAEFLLDLRSTHDGLSRRAADIERHFRQAEVLVVTTADPAPVREAGRFFEELPEIARTPVAVLFNRTLPLEWALPADPPPDGRHAALLAANLDRWGAESRRQADARREFAAHHRTQLATLPWQPTAPTDVDGLAALIRAGEGLPLRQVGVTP